MAEMKLTIRKSDALDDWYVIEKAEAPGEHHDWMEQVDENTLVYRDSARFSDACVEGTAYEMRAIARAIEKRDGVSFKRCAVIARAEPVMFWSPRNSTENGEVSLAVADALAAEIRALLGKEQSNG